MASTTIGGVNYTSNANSKTPYIDIYNQYAQQQNAIREAYQKQLDTNKSNDESKLNSQYDGSAKQNYINYMQNQKALPNSLNSLGVNGGASESSLIRLGTNYGNAIANNESGRNSGLTSLAQDYSNKKATYDEDFNNKLQQAYLTQLENQRKYEQEQREKDLQYFANTIHRYNNIAGYNKLIAALEKTTDPNRGYKIALVRQQIATQFPNGSGSSSGSGYSRSYSSGGYSSGYSSGSTAKKTTTKKKSSSNAIVAAIKKGLRFV